MKKFNDNKQIQLKLINQVMKSIFELPDEELYSLYKGLQFELEKRGVLKCSK